MFLLLNYISIVHPVNKILPQLIILQYFPSSLTIKLFKIAFLYCILLKPKTSKHQDNKQLFIANYYLIYKINSL